VGSEHLRAVQAESVAVRRRDGLEIGRGGARFRLAHAERNHFPSREQIRQISPPLLRAGIFGKCSQRPKISGLDHVGAARTNRRDLLDRDHRVHQSAALPAVRFRQGDAEQPLLGHQPGDVPRKCRRVRALQCAGRKVAFCEAAHGIPEGLLLGGQFEIHRRISRL
jgi:hypothetical protein